MAMDPGRAIEALTELRAQAELPEVQAEGPRHTQWRTSTDAVLANSLPGTSSTLAEFRGLSYSIGFWSGAPGEDERDRLYFASETRRAAALVDAAIFELGLLVDEGSGSSEGEPARSGTTIFVVHGHDGAAKYETLRILDRTTGLEAVVLHEQANRGGTVIEKLERHADDAAFAVALLTADDFGGARDADARPRARQNVVLELGWFIGLLGRDRVVVLHEDGVELTSDLAGIIYVPLDAEGAWRLKLLKEIEAVGIAVDRSRIP